MASKPKHSNYLGRWDGRPHYKAHVCGHDVRDGRTKLCKKCYADERKACQLYRTGHAYTNAAGYHFEWVNGKKVLTHRLIAERALGRKLKKGEVVHHINMDPSDNRNCNLLICTQSYHSELHFKYAKAFAKRLS